MKLTSLIFALVGAEADRGLALVQHHASMVKSSASKPHIVFILADDLGWNGVGYHANNRTKVNTSFLDELAASGVKLESYYAFCWCAPSRMSLLTGRNPWRSEAGYENFRPDIPMGTSLSYKMLPAALKDVGYSTHMIGKWHNGFHRKDYLPTNRGFDTAYGIVEVGTNHFDQSPLHLQGEYGEKTGFDHCKYNGHKLIDMLEDGLPAKNITPGMLSDDRYRQRLRQIIYNHETATPLFLYLALQMPHEPYEITSEYSGMYQLSEEENVYWGMVSHIDDTVRMLVQALQERDMYRNTIIVFTSDNGAAQTKFDEPFFANAPLRGHKGLLWDGGIRVPAFVAGGFVQDSARGRTLDGLMGVQDWYATLAYVSGAQVDNDGQFPSDSINNWLYIVGEAEKSARESLILHFHGQTPSVQLPSKTGFFGLEDGRQSVLRRGRYKMFKRPSSDGNILTEFYDLRADPGETNNVAVWVNIPQSIADYMVEMEDELDSSWFEAYQQPWFRTDVLDVNENDAVKACASWLKNGGYLTPWADEQDEMLLQARISVR